MNLLNQTIEQISREKGIDPKIIQEALEDAMVAAAKKYFRTEEDLQARFDPGNGTIDIFAVKQIVQEVDDATTQMSLQEALEVDDTFEINEFIEIPKPTADLGRIAAQTAKQVIFQKVREAEREIIFAEFSNQIGQLVNGIVRRIEGRDIILDIGRTESILPFSEQCQDEQYKLGDRARAVIIKVHRLSKGPQIVVSRSDPSLLIRLFEMEIPEVYDGTVVIKNAVREGGERAKVAVASNDAAVDPVGASVGMKGSRINAVIRELRGEKIDVIQYSDDITDYTTNALNPAKISRVLVSDAISKILEVIVPEAQLSLAIGKKGQNVRLASKLLGWEINITSDAEKKQEVLNQIEQLTTPAQSFSLSDLEGLGIKTREKLLHGGIESVSDLASKTVEELATLPGIGTKIAEKILAAAAKLVPDTSEKEQHDPGLVVAEEEQSAGKSESADLEAGAVEEELTEQENAAETETMEKKKAAADQTEAMPTTEAEKPLDSEPSETTSSKDEIQET